MAIHEDMAGELARRWPRLKSSIIYYLIRSGIGLVPVGRYAVANWLMNRRRFGLRTGIIEVIQRKWIVMPDSASTWAFPFGLKEAGVQHFLNNLLEDADAFVDCGANLGWYSFIASFKPHIKSIIAIEPIHRSIQFMEFIRRLNRIEHFRIVRGCVSDRNGSTSFSIQSGRFPEMGHVVDSGEEMPEKRCRVPSYTLESILATVDHRLNRICIKIDVEGHERRVLCSVSTEALKRVNSVIVEVHLYKFSEPGKELERICGVLSAVGAPRFIVLDRNLHPGYRRLWWHATKR